ncbi:hypothetical protein [Paractinoplanes deccanensis]|nr:hypothetical protein [Actinoplanes deccanensis]
MTGAPAWAARAAAVLGVLGAVWHLALAGHHAGHGLVLSAGLLLLSIVCARCGVHLWRRPSDGAAWRDLVVLAIVMTAMHAAAGGFTPLAVAVPAAQVGLALTALVTSRKAASRLGRSPVNARLHEPVAGE